MKIGLVGYGQVGKSTAAKQMPGWHRFSFAAPLKVIASNMLKCVDLDITPEDWDIPEVKARWRPLLVAVGCGVRSTDSGYWIKRLIYSLCAKNISDLDDVVIDDCRFANEVEWILKKKGLIIRIYRLGYGPANDEEARSIEEIDRLWPNLPAIANDDLIPSELGLRVIELANEFRLKGAV